LSIFTVLFFYVFFCPVANTPLLDRLSTWPIKDASWQPRGEIFGIQSQPVSFPLKLGTSERKLSGVLYKQSKSKDIVIVSHGNGGNMDNVYRCAQIACLLADKHSVFLYDYEGYGASEGNASYRCLVRDGLSAFDYVHQRLGYSGSQIILYGLSMGTGVTCEIARVHRPKAIILDSGYTSAENAAKFCYPFLQAYPSFLFPEPRYDNLAYLRGDHAPVLLIAPQKDWVVDPANSLKMANEAKPAVSFIQLPRSSHCSISTDDQKHYFESLQTFLHALPEKN